MNLITILGMHRSGTSAISGLLQTAGYNTGRTLLPPDTFNINGYYEDRTIVELNESILNELGNTWDDVRPVPLNKQDPDWLNDKTDNIKDAFVTAYADTNNAVIKDPRLCRLLPLWKRAFALLGITPLNVVMLRAPEEVAASLKCRDAMTIQKSALLYIAYLLDVEQHTRGERRLVINYSELLAGPLTVLAEIESALDTDITKRDETQLARISGFIDRTLCNGVDTQEASIMDASAPMRLANDLYKVLMSLDQCGSKVFQVIQSRFESMLMGLEPWLSEAAYGKQLRREILKPGKALIEAANLDAHAAVYWRTETIDYNEEQKITQPLAFEGAPCVLKFNLPALRSPITGLRLDPVDRPAYCQIKKVSVIDAQGKEAWNANIGEDLFTSHSEHMIALGPNPSDGSCQEVIAIHRDPYGTLCIPDNVLQSLSDGGALYIEMDLKLLSNAIGPLYKNILHLRNINKEQVVEIGKSPNITDRPIEIKPFIYGLDASIEDSGLIETSQLFDMTGYNTGNLVISYAIKKLLGSETKSLGWNQPLTEGDQRISIGVIALANQLGNHVDMGEMANVISSLQVNLVGIGLGAQAANIQSEIDLPSGTLNWVKAIIEHAPTTEPNIAVRGDFTRRILEKYNLAENTVVLGCPSLFINKDVNLGATIESRFSWGQKKRIAVTAGHPGWKHLSRIESSLTRIATESKGAYICQSPLEMVQLGRGESALLSDEERYSCREYISPNATDEEFMEWANSYATSFFSPSAWLEYLRRFDFVIGTRIHGVMLGLQAGVPSLCIAHDSSTEELCQTMLVPYTHARNIIGGIDIDDIPRLFYFDGASFDRNREALANGYANFMRTNNIEIASYMNVFGKCSDRII